MAFDVEGARKAGYSDAEIANYLSKAAKYDAKAARDAGYSDSELIAHLAPKVGRVDAIPGQEPKPSVSQAQLNAKEPSVLDTVIGTGEAALSAITGATGGLIGGVAGVVNNLTDPNVPLYMAPGSDPKAVEAAMAAGGRNIQQGAAALTYAPRTESGQQQAQALGEVAQNLTPVLAALPGGTLPGVGVRGASTLTNARGTLEAGARAVGGDAAATAVAGALDNAPARVSQAAQAARQRVQQLTGFSKPESTEMAGVGAAEAADAARRAETAAQLPVPLELTKGQASREFTQQRFEGETAKDPALGKPLRDRAEQQNRALTQNFEAMIDQVGAVAPDKTEAARVLVDQTLRPAAARAKAEYRAKYQAADKAGQMEAPVDLQPLADYLNRNRAGRSSAPILNTIADEIGVQGIGDGSLAEGTIKAGAATLKQTEELRKAVNRFVKDADPNDVRIGAEIKQVIDSITEGKGGQLYKEARAARQRFSQLFENNAVVSQLLKTKRGTADRAVALEDVFNKTILNGSREDLSMLRRTLDVSDQKAGVKPGTEGPGAQAWREMRGATLRSLVDEATKGVGMDTAGNPIFSAAGLNRMVQKLEQGGKLEFILGRKGAQTVRDINEIATVVKTLPPGAVNTSNTASVILAALAEAGATGALTGLPVPALSLLRSTAAYVKDRRVAARVQDALNAASAQQRSRAPAATPTF
jgi:hypothetical protein